LRACDNRDSLFHRHNEARGFAGSRSSRHAGWARGQRQRVLALDELSDVGEFVDILAAPVAPVFRDWTSNEDKQ
jgi:hypothetical protein